MYVYSDYAERKDGLDVAAADSSDIHKSLSMVSEHINEFIKKIEKPNEKGNSNMLFCSNFPSIIMQFDMVTVIIAMIFFIVAETGIYDPAIKKNRSIVNGNKGNPFGLQGW